MTSAGAGAGAGAGITTAAVAAAWPRELLDIALLVVDSIDSTQRLARVLLDRELSEGDATPVLVVAALEQTAGRGRRGRSWSSARGLGVWASLVARVDAERLAGVPMRAAAALAETLSGVGARVRIKWPNDLVAGRLKLGGILVDAVTRDRGGSFAVVGFGINVGHRTEELPLPGATSLALELGGEPPALGPLLAACVAGLRRRLAPGDEGWLESYRERSAHEPGEPIECDVEGERLAGRFLGFDARGFLRLETANDERVVASGDVFRW
jgi:BirA family biotin operon repressor/biotin-[acetyl-CoA-carboxylase] ligase